MGRKRRKRSLVVIANRLPIRRVRVGSGHGWEMSPGGLVSALFPYLKKHKGVWVGWPGSSGAKPKPFQIEGIEQKPVSLTPSEVDAFYSGFCNDTLWPLYHNGVRVPSFHRHWWWPYVEINQRFSQAALQVCSLHDTIWVHDYHLQLVPQILRKERPRLRIGFFLHIPFPAPEIFQRLPWRKEILEGLLGADVIGFQTAHDSKNFCEAVSKLTNAKCSASKVQFEGRSVQVKHFPISIDIEHYTQMAHHPEVVKKSKNIRHRFRGQSKIILGIDRLDYTKGIDLRLKAIETLLKQKRLSLDDFVFIQVVVPSREKVPLYVDMKNQIEQMVSHLNGDYGEPGKTPIQYLHRSLKFEELMAYYRSADIMLVTPLQDGMNLVAKEYLCTRSDDSGALILSEFAGASEELKHAFLVNPHDVDGLANQIERAMKAPEKELKVRMKRLRETINKRTVYQWADEFLEALGE